ESCLACVPADDTNDMNSPYPESTPEIDPVFQFVPGFPRRIKPEDLSFFNQLLGQAVIIRDETMQICWCNDAYVRMGSGRTREEIIGSTMRDFMAPIAAKEREDILRTVIETEKPSAHIQFCGDKRLLNVLLPLYHDAFGKRGVLIVIMNAPLVSPEELSESVPLVTTPCLNELDALSARELEVFYYIATGLSNSEIADLLFRAVKTIENHVASIHRKLQTSNRSKLVRYGVERGIPAFTPEQWKILINGAARVRKSLAND
ncbi:MAG: PAS domain-containing protein, partial [Phycisphaerales bacterium]|nr:PAS domain-containing protein [Phycisphaerales bacterium]